MAKRKFRTPTKKSHKPFGDVLDDEPAKLDETNASRLGSASTRSTLCSRRSRPLWKPLAVVQGPLHTFNACVKARRRKLYIIAHHRAQRQLDLVNLNKPIMLTKLQFLDSIQDKTWF